VLAILICCAAACGRGGFDAVPVPDAAIDAAGAVIDAMPDAPPPILACNGPRFSIDAATTALSATSTMGGYDVFTVGDAGQVHGYTYNFTGDVLAGDAHDVPIAPSAIATGPLAPLAVGDDVLMLLPYGPPPLPATTTGTSLIALDPQLGTKSATMNDGLTGTSGALARNASGAIALITQTLDNDAVRAQLIADDGRDRAGPYTVIDGSEAARSQMILPAKNSFLLSWVSNSHVRAGLVDVGLQSPTPVSISPETAGANSPRAAYLASADRYLFVWYQKLPDNSDQVWGSLRDSTLADVGGGPILLSGTISSAFPVVVASDHDFLVVWETDTGSHLGAVRVTRDGAVTQPGIRSNGGTAVAWDLVVRYGQAALAWLETGVGPNLWLDPLCNP
jgi:hypothetical protein